VEVECVGRMCSGVGIKYGVLQFQMPNHEFCCWLDGSLYSH
jgi:hypothetical protein